MIDPKKLTLMVEQVGGGYVPIVEYSPGNDRQREQADNVIHVLRAIAGVSAYVQSGAS